MAAGTTAYAGAGIAPSSSNASVSLLNSADTGASDSIGAYVLSDALGDFDISGDYTCTPNSQVYVFAHGGDAGGGANSAAGFLALLGNCPAAGNFSSVPFIEVNEVSTVAAAYSFAGYASDATHVSSNGSPQALTGIANAFATASNLVDLGSGAALTTTPAGNGTVPTATINTLANILASCVNTANVTAPGVSGSPHPLAARPHIPPFSAPCVSLADAVAGSIGGFSGYLYDTATAAIFIAHSPGAHTSALYTLPTPQAPFSPILTTQPNDFTLAIPFNGGGIGDPIDLAIDASGDVWVTNTGGSVSELSPLGAALSPSAGFTGGGTGFSDIITFDTSGNAWTANKGSNLLAELSNSGTPISTSAGYTGDGLDSPVAAAFDTSGNLWVVNNLGSSLSKFSGTGVPTSGSGFTGGGLSRPVWIAIDASGDLWAVNGDVYSLSKFSSSGSPISTSAGYTGGGLNDPFSLVIDSSGDVWTANLLGDSLSEFSSSGSPISPSSGFTGGGLSFPTGISIDGAGNVWVGNAAADAVSEFSNAGAAISPSSGFTGANTIVTPDTLAVDSAGNVWIPNHNDFVTELVGAAVPIETPFVQALQDSCIALRPCLPQT
jgi:hypothetical protein